MIVIGLAVTVKLCALPTATRDVGVALSVARGVKLTVPAPTAVPLNVTVFPDTETVIQPGSAPALASIVTGGVKVPPNVNVELYAAPSG